MAAKAEAARGTAPAKDPSPRTKWHTGSSGPLAQLVVVQRDLMVDHTLCSPVVAVACAQQSPAVLFQERCLVTLLVALIR